MYTGVPKLPVNTGNSQSLGFHRSLIFLSSNLPLQLAFNRQNADEAENEPVPWAGLWVCVVLHFFPVIFSGPH